MRCRIRTELGSSPFSDRIRRQSKPASELGNDVKAPVLLAMATINRKVSLCASVVIAGPDVTSEEPSPEDPFVFLNMSRLLKVRMPEDLYRQNGSADVLCASHKP
jgi:hypothetical protein